MKIKKFLLTVSVVVYLISLSQKTFCTPNGCGYFAGILNLISGWIGVFMGNFPAFPWLANPLLFLSWYLFKKQKTNWSFLLSVISFILMLSFLLVDEIIHKGGSIVSRVLSYQIGYWLWVLSSLIMLTANLMVYKTSIKLNKLVARY
ncbi:hypothetical protein [Aestuariibaculum sediminum]|uniref:Uncharacterized protein n=1 Tax=Aestuariibaculum sediminum TaxID=2770637 RepID=A0A8J6QA59_9FLAO|nr:hypothetical protein [Aestuariibaculum sediminum]MBD0831591.1 hypothetical protein [Aestuariibaculum sediminum]